MSDFIIFVIMENMMLVKVSKLQKFWQEGFWSPTGYSSFCENTVQLYWVWNVLLDLLRFFGVFFLSIFLLCQICLDIQEAYLFY